ncbi:MAG: glycosyltransferase family 39 protein [Planctomycetota bacterium]
MSRIWSTRVLLVVFALAAGLRLWAATQLPLSGDEAYHWEWSRRLAGAYYDHPGLTAWLIASSEHVWPWRGELAVRLPAFCCAVAATLIARGFARDLARGQGVAADGVRRAGQVAAALVFFAPLPAALSVYMSTDPPLLPLWLGAVWALYRALDRGGFAAWIACGALVGAALDTKLLALSLLGTCAAALFLHRDARRWLARLPPWLALATVGLVASPMLWWNAHHDWSTFRFNFGIRQRTQTASMLHPLVFLAGQAGIVTPGFLVLAVRACAGRAMRRRPADLAVALGALLPLAFFALVSLRREVGAHWTAAPWLVAFVVLAVAMAQGPEWTRQAWSRWAWRSSWVLSIVVLVLAHVFAAAPRTFGSLDVVRGQPRRVLRNLFGWSEIGQRASTVAAELRRQQAEPRGVFLMSNQYGTTAALAFYTPEQPLVQLWSAPRSHGRSYFEWADWQALAGQDAVYVSKHELEAWELPFLREHFADAGEIELVPIERDGVVLNRFFLVRCRGFSGRQPFPLPR